jgi:hypothetical protein
MPPASASRPQPHHHCDTVPEAPTEEGRGTLPPNLCICHLRAAHPRPHHHPPLHGLDLVEPEALGQPPPSHGRQPLVTTAGSHGRWPPATATDQPRPTHVRPRPRPAPTTADQPRQPMPPPCGHSHRLWRFNCDANASDTRHPTAKMLSSTLQSWRVQSELYIWLISYKTYRWSGETFTRLQIRLHTAYIKARKISILMEKQCKP